MKTILLRKLEAIPDFGEWLQPEIHKHKSEMSDSATGEKWVVEMTDSGLSLSNGSITLGIPASELAALAEFHKHHFVPKPEDRKVNAYPGTN